MKLGYFNTLENNHIRTLENGVKIFYPQGAIGRGYFISSPELELILRARIRKYYVGLIVLGGLVGGLVGGFGTRFVHHLFFETYALVIVTAGFIGYLAPRLYYSPQTRRMERSLQRHSLMAAWTSASRTLHPALLIGLFFVTLLFAVAGFWLYSLRHDSKMLLSGGFFSLLLIPYCIMIWKRFF